MRIALLYLGRKGAGPKYSIEMVKALSNKKVDILAIVSENIENKHEWEILRNNKTISIYYVKTFNSWREFLINTFDFRIFIALNKVLSEFKPDVLYSTMSHVWNPIVFSIGRNIKQRIKTIHDPVPHIGENTFFERFLLSTEYKQVDKIVVLSQNSVPIAIDRGLNHSQIAVIPHANFSCYKQTYLVNTFKVYYKILFFGRITKYKGLGILLEALKEVINTGLKIKLVIAGNGDCSDYEEMFLELNEYLNLNIRWISDDDIESFINDVDFVVLPYIEASQSGVIPLAYSFGKPVIATNVGGLPEQVINNKTGLIISPASVIELKNAIIKLYSDFDLLKSMGLNSSEYAQNELSWEKSADLLLGFISKD
jgi:glycosyltransferase involved in cell wall biosynthesis